MSFILEGDCIKVMKEMEEKSIDLIITSPPYFQQRDYGMENEIGKEEKYQKLWFFCSFLILF
jgi:site-specific DNA-methyltransferase (adenine-specific)